MSFRFPKSWRADDHHRGYMQTRGLELAHTFVMVVIGYTLLQPGNRFG